MKKVFITLMATMAVMMGLASCKCTPDNQEPVEPAVEQAELVVENLISTDREQMFLEYGENYRWFETTAVLTDFLDGNGEIAVDDTVSVVADTAAVDTTAYSLFESVTNVFQAVEGDGQSFDTQVVIFTHDVDGSTVEAKHGFWIEDFPLNEEQITLTFADAVERVLEANYPKPHSRYVVLRKEVGPVAANPQYVFGNRTAQLYVDAVTGKVSDSNPVFAQKGFKMPLGEWP